jgi:hypothetical protein
MEGRTPSCLGRAAVPVKRVWHGLSARLGLRRTTGEFVFLLRSSCSCDRPNREQLSEADDGAGLGELRKEVRTCEYEDVHVMWEMLGGMDDAPRGPRDDGRKRKNKNKRKKAAAGVAAWGRLVSYCCACAR